MILILHWKIINGNIKNTKYGTLKKTKYGAVSVSQNDTLKVLFFWNFWLGGTKKFQFPLGTTPDGRGTWRKKFPQKPILPPRPNLTHYWCFKHEIKLLTQFFKPKCCQNWCKAVLLRQILVEGTSSGSRKGTSVGQCFAEWRPQSPHQKNLVMLITFCHRAFNAIHHIVLRFKLKLT